MKHKVTNWMLLIGAVLLGGFILIFERGGPNSRQQERRGRTVFSVYPESIEQILLERDGVQIECTKTAGIWRLTKPADAPVDSGIVEKMIAGLARVERGELITAETLRDRNLTPANYGFDTPRARITFKNNRGTFTWLIGRDAPVGKTLYVMPAAGGDIIAAPRTLLNLVPQDPSWIRDRTLFSGEVAAVRGLDLRRTAGFLQLRQPEGNGWVMQQPHTGRADIQPVHAMIEKIFSGRIADFVSDEKADLTAYGLEKPAYELTVFTQDERTQTLLVGKPLPEKPETRYAKRIESDSVFTVPAEWTKDLETDAGLLRSRHVVSLQPEHVTAIQLARGEQQIELLRTNSQWQVVRPIRWDADAEQTGELLKALTGGTVEEFIDTPSAAQTAQMAAAPWRAVLTAGGKTNTLHISDLGTNGMRLVQCNDELSFCTATGSVVRDTFIDPLFYRSRTVLEVNPSLIQKITVQSGGTELSVQKTDNGVFAASQTSRQVNAEALTDLMWTLNELRTERYVDFNPVSLKPYGLDQPQTALTVTLSDTNAIGRMVLLGSKTENGRFAMIQGQNIVFVVSEKTAQTLTRELTVPIEKQTEEINRP
ncbi:MAG: DUF4340 domain-containing protein [Kiritimatiellales bacterium]|jgi:hypothetical protein